MSLLLHTSVSKQKVKWECVQNRSFQFYLAFKILLCLSIHQKDKAPSCRNVLGDGKTEWTGDWQEARVAAPMQMQTTK